MLFYNLPESEQEDPFTIIREVLNEKMGIDENGDIEIERAHRLGRKREERWKHGTSNKRQTLYKWSEI